MGPDHQRTIVALSNLAAFKRSNKDFDGAAADYRDLLVRQTRSQGREHPVTARLMSGLGETLLEIWLARRDSTALKEAEALYVEALAILEPSLGAVHPQVGVALDRLATARSHLGRDREAKPLADRAVRILKAAYGDAHQSTASALAHQAMIQSRLDSLSAGRGRP